jgi:hypothetical protein
MEVVRRLAHRRRRRRREVRAWQHDGHNCAPGHAVQSRDVGVVAQIRRGLAFVSIEGTGVERRVFAQPSTKAPGMTPELL